MGSSSGEGGVAWESASRDPDTGRRREVKDTSERTPMHSTMDEALESLHDELLAKLPEGASHNEEECPFCSPDGGEGMADRTLSEEELQAAIDRAVAEATTALNAKITELEGSQQTKTLEDAVAAAKTEMQAQIDELTSKLDASVLETQQAKDAHTAVQAAWDKEKADTEEATALAARRDERIAKVKEAASFPDEYLEANADRFAAMSDEDFEARLEEWKVIAAKSEIPNKTAIHASRDGNGNGNGKSNGSMLGELRNLRTALADPTL